jgi:hypothetical protein
MSRVEGDRSKIRTPTLFESKTVSITRTGRSVESPEAVRAMLILYASMACICTVSAHVRRVDPCLAKGSFGRPVVFDLRIVHNHHPLSERRCRSSASRKMPVTFDDVGSGTAQIYFGFRTRHRHSIMRRSWHIAVGERASIDRRRAHR